MQESVSEKPEKPKILGPKPTIPSKPTIASKPKYIPPVNTKIQKQVRDDFSKPNPIRRTNSNPKPIQREPPQYSREAPQNSREAPQYARDAPQYAREAPQYAREAPQYTREAPQYSREGAQFARESPQYAREAPQYARDSPQYARDSPQYARESPQYARESPPYSRETPQYARESPQYTREANIHTREVNQHHREANQHPREANQHPREANQHPREANQHSREATQLSRETSHPREAPPYPREAPQYTREPPQYTCQPPEKREAKERLPAQQAQGFHSAETFQSYVHIQAQKPTNFPTSLKETYTTNVEHNIKREYTYSTDQCDKYRLAYETQQSEQEKTQKAPTSPSTVCCSILSNTTQDCCGIIHTNKKELNGKGMTKHESVDSNSSDSGGFKDFVQLDVTKKQPTEKEPQTITQPLSHQRKVSQPDFLEKNDRELTKCHQRNASQPDYMSQEIRQSIAQNKQQFIANAQALAQYLPQAEQKMFLRPTLSVDRADDSNIRQHIMKFNVEPPQTFSDKADDSRRKPRAQIVSNGQFQQSTKKLEELLSQRLERDKLATKGQNCLIDGESSQDVEQKMLVQKQIQAKLHADLQQTVKQIQEIQSIELRLPQNRKWTESNRSQPAIGLKHTPKSRGSRCLNSFTIILLDTNSGTEILHSKCRISDAIKRSMNVKTGPRVRQLLMNSHEMDDPEIQETVESILGKGAKVVDCEKKSSIKEEEVLFINGIPVTLEGRDGVAIKQALMTGQVPPCDLLNTLLIKTGILKAPVKLDTSLSVKSTTVVKEEVTVSRDGKVVDERSRETKEHNYYTSAISEVYEPIKIIPTAELLNGQYNTRKFNDSGSGKYSDNNGYETGSDRKFGSCSSASSYESDGPPVYNKPNTCLSKDSGHLSNSVSTNKVDFTQSSIDSLSSLDETDFKNDLVDKFRKCSVNGNGFKKDYSPTIFGTVASDLTPKDCSNRRSLPQTPQSKSFAAYNGDPVPEHITESALQHDNSLVYRDGNLISGPLEALIQHMVPTEVYYPDRAYLFAFLLSSRLFIKPHDLLSRVRSLSESQQGLGTAVPSHPGVPRFTEHLVQLLAEWSETFPYDFRDERVMAHVRTITQQCCTLNPSLRSNVSSLLHNLLQRLTALEAYEKSLDNPAVQIDENCGDITEVCPNAGILAQQLTQVELERLSYIGPEEFVQAFAKENPLVETSFKDMKKTHNLEQYVQWFNRLSYFVATQVCKYSKKKQRVRVVEYWIEVGRECFNIGNFNSLMAIIAGLNMSPISRLKKTWNKIQSGKFAILEHQMDPSSNFSSYRSTLKAAMWRSAGATDQRQRIVIPFFSLLVKDLYFLNQGCSSKLPNGHINFEKFWQLAKQVTEFMAWKQVTCPFEKDPKIISILQHGIILSENALALASFECEPPDNNQEKERCKSLKAEGSAT